MFHKKIVKIVEEFCKQMLITFFKIISPLGIDAITF